MTMIGYFVDHGIRIVVAVALLAVMSAPIRLSEGSQIATSPIKFPRSLAVLKFVHGSKFALSSRSSLKEADSLKSDIEDELDADKEDELIATPLPTSVSFDVLPSPCPKLHSEQISFAVALPARPLRC